MTASTKNCRLVLVGTALMLASMAVVAMDMSFRSTSLGNNNPSTRLLLSGEIRRGDAERLRQFLAANSDIYLRSPHILLDSPGGNVEETLQLAQVFREILADVYIFPPQRCVSACFFLYVAAPSRMALNPNPGTGLAIHRPFFAADVTRQMSAANAEAAHNSVFVQTKRWLQDQLVPQALIDKLFSLPSTQAYWLTSEDIETLGNRAAWYEEWLLARCPNYINAERRVYATTVGTADAAEALRAFGVEAKCESTFQYAEREGTLARYARASKQRK